MKKLLILWLFVSAFYGINSLENDNCTNEESDRSLSREGRKLLFPTSTIYQVSLK